MNYLRQNVINDDSDDNTKGAFTFFAVFQKLEFFECLTSKIQLEKTFLDLIESADQSINLIGFCITVDHSPNNANLHHMNVFLRLAHKYTLRSVANVLLDSIEYNVELAGNLVANRHPFLYVTISDNEANTLAHVTRNDMNPCFHNVQTSNFS